MEVIQIQRVRQSDPITGEPIERFAVAAMAISTPAGPKLIPNPSGNQVQLFESLEEAQHSVHMAGFAALYEGRKTYQPPKPKMTGTPRVIHQDPMAAAVPILIQRLKDAEPNVVANSAMALGELQATEAVAMLTEILGHDDPAVRKQVADALAKLGDTAVEHLKRAWQIHLQSKTKDAPYARLTIMTAYASMCHFSPMSIQQVLPQVIEALEDDNWLVRAQAAQVIALAKQVLRELDR